MTTRASRTEPLHDRSGSARPRARGLTASVALVLTLVLAAGACSSTTGSDTIATKATSPGTAAASNETTLGTEPPSASDGTDVPTTETDPDNGTGNGTAVPTSRPTTSLGGSNGSTTTTFGDTPDNPSPPTSTSKPTVSVKATPDNLAFCQTFAKFVNDPPPVNSDSTTFLSIYKTMFQQLTDLSPAELAPDWQTVNAIIQGAADFESLGKTTDTPAFTAATDRISAWTTTNCGFDPNKGSSSSSSSSDGSISGGSTG